MKNIIAAVTALGCLTAALPASAADLSGYNSNAGFNPMTYGAPVSGWSGLYAGANLGYSWGRADTNIVGQPDYDMRGFSGGVQAGYNFEAGSLVFGGEADFQLANIYNTQSSGGTTYKLGVDGFGSIRGRVGYSFDAFMPYATAGIAIGRGTASATTGPVTVSESQMHYGWTVGAGLEVAVTDQITAKGEYLYTDLGTQTYGSGMLAPGTANINFGTARVGVNYKF